MRVRQEDPQSRGFDLDVRAIYAQKTRAFRYPTDSYLDSPRPTRSIAPSPFETWPSLHGSLTAPEIFFRVASFAVFSPFEPLDPQQSLLGPLFFYLKRNRVCVLCRSPQNHSDFTQPSLARSLPLNCIHANLSIVYSYLSESITQRSVTQPKLHYKYDS